MKQIQDINIHQIDRTNETDLKLFLEFPLSIYENKKLIEYYIPKVKSLVSIPGDFELFIAESSNHDIVGRMVMGKNDQIRDDHNMPFAHIGLFDVIEDYSVFKQMIDFGRKYFQKHRYLLFPFFNPHGILIGLHQKALMLITISWSFLINLIILNLQIDMDLKNPINIWEVLLMIWKVLSQITNTHTKKRLKTISSLETSINQM
ncbi:MAG: hypothetical protein OMM_02593 [Candidatus Magnetoglobus multicellularis str. Araruama]|uniref:Uncharacterized protein n=1 Tax=Candidatus Magnetoglobus multicellularis str. Araruama TaxID=890399 RepID=A0A1V1P912_9BACT|nr:MAG: hypothetical protein OMM_02593 [Candidatus Magnetoglobus multicellularis str. Araruama]